MRTILPLNGQATNRIISVLKVYHMIISVEGEGGKKIKDFFKNLGHFFLNAPIMRTLRKIKSPKQPNIFLRLFDYLIFD